MEWVSTQPLIGGYDNSYKTKNYRLTVDNKRLRNENKILTDKLNINNNSLEKVAYSRVIARTIGPLEHRLMIDSGKVDGISQGQAVTSDGVLVGVIDKVKKNTSEVILVRDQHFRLPVRIQDTQVDGLLRGDISTGVIDRVTTISPLERGMLVVTSDLGGFVPAGIVVGKVGVVQETDSNVFYKAQVVSTLNPYTLKIVEIVIG